MLSENRSDHLKPAPAVAELRRWADGWLLDCRYRQMSRSTLDTRRRLLEKLLWWLVQQERVTCVPPSPKFAASPPAT